MTSIGAHHYILSLDSSKFEKGAKLSRSEARSLRTEMKAIETPAEKYQKRLDRIETLYKKGAVTGGQYRRMVDNLQGDFRKASAAAAPLSKNTMLATDAVKGLGGGLAMANPYVLAGTAAMAGLTAAGAGVVKVVSEILGEFEGIDEIAKQSDKLGVATEELIGLRMAASEMSGMSSGQFDQAFQRMTRRIAEAANGTGEAKDAIKQLGLDAKELAKDPTQAFKQIADAIQGVDSQSERLRLAFKLFDSEGAALVNTLNGGSDAINAVMREADELGLTFSSIEADRIEEANESWARMESAIKGLKVQAAVFIAEDLNAGLVLTVELLKDSVAMTKEFTSTLGSIESAMGPLSEVIQGINAVVNPHMPAFGELHEQTKRKLQLEREQKAIEERRRGGDTAFDPLAEGWNTEAELGIGLPKSDAIEEGKKAAAERMREAEKQREAAKREEDRKRQAREREQKRQEDAQKKAADQLRDSLLTPTERFEKEVKRIAELQDKGLINDETFQASVTAAAERFGLNGSEEQRAAGPAAIEAGSQAAREIELRARGFGVVKKPKTDHEKIVEEVLQQIAEGVGVEVEFESLFDIPVKQVGD